MQQEVNHRMQRIIVGIASLVAFSLWSPALCVPPLEHIIREEFLLTHTQTGLLFTIPALMLIVLGIPGGFVADKIGVRKAAGIGITIIAVGTILRGTATSASNLIAFTFIYGAGVGLTAPCLPKLITGWFSREKIGIAIGIYVSAMFIGNAAAMAMTIPVILPLTNTFQGVFLFWSIPPTMAAILWWILIREFPQDNIIDERVRVSNTSFSQILQNKNLWLVSILFLLFIFFVDGWSAWAPALMMLKGATENTAGLIVSISMLIGIPTTLFIPRFSYKLGRRKLFLWIPAIALALAAWGAIYITIPLIWPFVVLLGFALYAVIPIILALPTEMVSKEEVGTATGLILSIGNIGGVIGPMVGGRIFDLTGSLDSFLLVLIGISIAATAIAFRLPETGPRVRKSLS